MINFIYNQRRNLLMSYLSHIIAAQADNNQDQYNNTFEDKIKCQPKITCMLHSIFYIAHIRNMLAQNLASNNEYGLSNDQLLNISPQYSSKINGRIVGRELKNMLDSLGQGQELTNDHLLQVLFQSYKIQFIGILIINTIGILIRLGLSVIVLLFLHSLNDSQYSKAYIFATIIALLAYSYQTINNFAYLYAHTIAAKIKSSLSLLLYAKISSLSQHRIQQSSIGKLIGLIGSDLGILEIRLANYYNLYTFPIIIIGITVFLTIQFSWPALVGIMAILMVVPISSFVSKRKSQYIEEANKFKDKRIQMITQLIEGVKFVKIYGWEYAFEKMISDLRSQEIQLLKKVAFNRSLERSLGTILQVISALTLFTLSHYVTTANNIGVIKIFSALEILDYYRSSLFNFFDGIGLYFQIKIVFSRFASIFNINNQKMERLDRQPNLSFQQIKLNQEMQIHQDIMQTADRFLQEHHTIHPDNSKKNISYNADYCSDDCIIFQSFHGFWNKEIQSPKLKNISLKFKKGFFYGITGKVGSGKSALLSAILQQIPYYTGEFFIRGSIALVQQQPIIFSSHIRQNILFGKPFNKELYQKVIIQSCLKADIELMPQLDETIVGQKGITLSGGQKARLSIARALYADADILLFDDPISAVDSKVARFIYNNCLKKLSQTKAVILVTHQLNFLLQCDHITIMNQGQIYAKGTPSEIYQYLKIVNLDYHMAEDIYKNGIDSQELLKQQQQLKDHPQTQKDLQHEELGQKVINVYYKQKEIKVTLNSFVTYLFVSKKNYFIFILAMLLVITQHTLNIIYFRLISMYQDVQKAQSWIFGSNFTYFWIALAGIVIVGFVIVIIMYYLINLCILNSNQQIHKKMIAGIIRSPSNFFDKTPSGQLINKFSNDINILDNSLSSSLIDGLEGLALILAGLINACITNIFFISPVVITLILGTIFFFYSRNSILSCKQIQLKTKTPVLNFYNQTIEGLIQIKIHNRRADLIQKFHSIINNSTKAFFAYELTSRQFSSLVTNLVIIMLVCTLMIGIQFINSSNLGVYAIILVSFLLIIQFVGWFLKQIIVTTNLMLSSERAFSLVNLSSEKQFRNQYDIQVGLQQQVNGALQMQDIHVEWPQQSYIEIQNLSVRYDEHLPLVLNSISFSFKANEKIGIVGRTGAGKSSIIQTLFRLIQPQIGSRYILGGYDALKMGLHSLRQHISVIPQTPFLFKGTVRQNIDPFEKTSDDELWRVLKQSNLDMHVKSLPLQLETDITNISLSFSVGQKQLLCLARALFSKNKILILDEATSNVDMNTDNFIQQVLKDKFKNTTIITIAHRLITIADYDRIIVMQKGKIGEIGSPHDLIEKKGLFYSMVMNSGKNADQIIKKATHRKQL